MSCMLDKFVFAFCNQLHGTVFGLQRLSAHASALYRLLTKALLVLEPDTTVPGLLRKCMFDCVEGSLT